MKKQTLFFAILVLACASTCVFGQLKRSVTKAEKLDFGPGGTLTVKGAPNGSIKVVGSPRSEIEITTVIEIEGASEADLDAMALATGYVMQESMSLVSILSVGPDQRGKGDKKLDKKLLARLKGLAYRIDYTLTVPRYCDLNLTVGKGGLAVEGVEGNHRIDALESDVKLDLIGGGLLATVGKGSLALTMPNRSWRGGAIDVSVATGTIDAFLPMNLSAEFDAAILRAGSIENGIDGLKPRNRNTPFTDKAIVAKAGAGGAAVKLTVGDGTLRLMRPAK